MEPNHPNTGARVALREWSFAAERHDCYPESAWVEPFRRADSIHLGPADTHCVDGEHDVHQRPRRSGRSGGVPRRERFALGNVGHRFNTTRYVCAIALA